MKRETKGVIAACSLLVASGAATGEWLWTGFLAALVAILGVFEAIGIKTGRQTLTQRFRELSEGRKMVLTTGIVGFIGWLMYHLWIEGGG
jgi:hypothetical protein